MLARCWKLIGVVFFTVPIVSASTAEASVLCGKIDPDKNLIGLGYPKSELTIESSPSGASIGVVYRRSLTLLEQGFGPDAQKSFRVVACLTPCKVKLPRASGFSVFSNGTGQALQLASAMPQWTNDFWWGFKLKPNKVLVNIVPGASQPLDITTGNVCENEALISRSITVIP